MRMRASTTRITCSRVPAAARIHKLNFDLRWCASRSQTPPTTRRWRSVLSQLGSTRQSRFSWAGQNWEYDAAGNDARQDNVAAPSANILHHSIGQFRHLLLLWRWVLITALVVCDPIRAHRNGSSLASRDLFQGVTVHVHTYATGLIPSNHTHHHYSFTARVCSLRW